MALTTSEQVRITNHWMASAKVQLRHLDSAVNDQMPVDILSASCAFILLTNKAADAWEKELSLLMPESESGNPELMAWRRLEADSNHWLFHLKTHLVKLEQLNLSHLTPDNRQVEQGARDEDTSLGLIATSGGDTSSDMTVVEQCHWIYNGLMGYIDTSRARQSEW